MSNARKNIFTVPAGLSFTQALAQTLLEETKGRPEALSQIRILLPTRRACRALQEAFLTCSDGGALLLPRMQPLGDIDEEELALSIAGQDGIEHMLDLPPAMAPLKRQILLARTIMALPGFGQGPDHALALAAALGRLMDQVYTENLSLENLDTLAPENFSTHWQITLDFLKILSQRWPDILAAHNMIDGADRRNSLLLALSTFWQNQPPQERIIAAGSTGSIPATAQLLDVIAELPNGQVVLPGLDTGMEPADWNAMDETHPQYGFKLLLDRMKVDYTAVPSWDDRTKTETAPRNHLAREMMRPAQNTAQWMILNNAASTKNFEQALNNLSLFECAHEHEEAQVIALLMREALEQPDKTAALVTPDRALAKRVAMACRRWSITIDDSAGQPLDQTPLGAFLMLCVEACIEQLAPVSLLALLKNAYAKIAEHSAVAAMERLALRGPKPAPGFTGLRQRLEEKAQQKDTAATLRLLDSLEAALNPFMDLCTGRHKFGDFITAHLRMAETLCTGPDTLWRKEEGEEAARLFAELQEQAHLLGDMTARDYADSLGQLLRARTIRAAWNTHPRLMILGQLEARLINADLVILGGLNEGTWPPDPGHDPWMSRPMRKEFGLPTQERSIGLAAHDFVQGFCAPRVALTRAKRQDGAPTVPARWLQRLDTVLDAAGLEKSCLKNDPHLYWARTLDQHDEPQPYTRPAPTPPVDMRPKELPATQIENWQKDPYSIYARYVLRLRKLDPLEQDVDAARRGAVLHDVLDHFVKAYPAELPKNAAAILQDFAQEEIEHHHDDPSIWSFWWPRFSRLGDWYLNHEAAWRTHTKPHKTEVSGSVLVQSENHTLRLTARADRIDFGTDGAAIIDYKSGGTYSLSKIKSGALPQLPAEALILTKGGFEGIAPQIGSLSYWTLTGGAEPGKITEINNGLEEIVTRTEEGLQALIEAFGTQDTPYYSLPRPDNAPRFNDYEHLARIKEWAALGDSESAEAA